jgi:hypothetical protein
MRTTVGPLPPAVYWRRRIVVLAVLLLVVLFVALACTGGGGDNTAEPKGSGNTQPIPDAGDSSGGSGEGVLVPTTDEPSFADSAPVGGPGGSVATDVPAGPVSVAPGLPAPAQPGATGSCTDAEMALTPVPSRTAAKRGQPINLQLIIRNASTRTCSRDVGADLQEIYIKQGALKIWSSDVCGLAKGSRVEQFEPGGQRTYLVTWNGRDSTRCTGGMPAGNYPPAGRYELLGRLGVKVSDPVTLTLVA